MALAETSSVRVWGIAVCVFGEGQYLGGRSFYPRNYVSRRYATARAEVRGARSVDRFVVQFQITQGPNRRLCRDHCTCVSFAHYVAGSNR